MKVIHLTSVRLIVKETLFGLRILSFFTTMIGFYIFISFEPPVDLFGGFCIAIASLINVVSPTEICTFDRTLDRITIHRLRGFKQKISHYRMSAVQDVAIEENHVCGTPFYRIRLSLHSGERVPITQSVSTDMTVQKKLAQEISSFIHFRQAVTDTSSVEPVPQSN